MSFREKSAWVMAAVMTVAGLYYLKIVIDASESIGATAPPMVILIAYVVLVVIAAVNAQIILALSSPKEANAPADERERPMLDRAGNWSGYVLAAGVVTSLLHFLAHNDGFLLFHTIMGSLIVAQIAEYAFQILLLRRSS